MYQVSSSSDSKYFSRLLNLIGSINKSNDCISSIEVWDLGLTKLQKRILTQHGISIKSISNFTPHWNQCYTWKLFVFKNSDSKLFLHLDAGNIVKGDLLHVFEKISRDGYFLIDQGQRLSDITPYDYKLKFNPVVNINDSVFAAGNIGLNKSRKDILAAIDDAYKAAVDGFCLGFSEIEMYRDTDGIGIKRNCKIFRHDQTVINLIFRKWIRIEKIHDHKIYASIMKNSESVIFNNRGYSYDYISYFSENKFYKFFLPLYCHLIDTKIRATALFKRIIRVFN
ncbi:hypothetical protein [Vibrio metschnikovii]|nr:hypothetical protein [Vibrio metschnikovii]